MIQVGQILFILSVLVILHEFGHYITAKWFKVRIEKFYLFMDAGFSLVKKKIGETEWGIGWLPIGGYVKLAGMIDESMDTEQMKGEPQPWEFRSKPAWQRLIIMLGGIIVNILLAWLIYSTMFMTVGKKVISTEELQKNGLFFGEVGQSVGFRNGDRILKIDGKQHDDFKFMSMAVLFGDKIEIERNGEKKDILLTDEQKGAIIKKEGRGFVGARMDNNLFFIDSVGKNNFGLSRFDQITAINNKKVIYVDEIFDLLNHHQNDSVNLTVKRANKEIQVKVKIDSTAKTGIGKKNTLLNFNYDLTKAVVSNVQKKSGAEKGGVKFDDKIIAVSGKKVTSNIDFKKSLSTYKPNQAATITVLRNGKKEDLNIVLDKYGKAGIGFSDNSNEKYTKTTVLSFTEAIPAAISQTWSLFIYNINSLKLILKPKTGAYAQVKSPVGIARQLPDTWDWEFIWNFTALFSIGLAFMNLLPIPGLDGGHALFTIVEMITGKTLSEKAAGYVQTAGMIILLTLMALTFGKDIFELIVDKFF
ncbi:site-2 protease family protein [Flavobacterium suncheonense]|uniref:site-2 protease family protein n=1 Tax=Flavobacterium suncheonense TaxID=350894 RepID=UPI00041051CC|nr:site-2 protease family protein [Flavobacterium suncheonense]